MAPGSVVATARWIGRRRPRSSGGALAAVGERQPRLEVGVLLAQALVLGAQGLKALAQRRRGRTLASRDAVGRGAWLVAQSLDLRRTDDLVTAWWLLKWRQSRPAREGVAAAL